MLACVLDVKAECVYKEGSVDQTCDGLEFGRENTGQCSSLPTSLTMLFNGGNCSQSDHVGLNNYTCQDFDGGPTVAEGEEARIVVTDEDTGATYFQGILKVGSTFVIRNNRKFVGANLLITIRSPLDNNVQQLVSSDSSFCGHGASSLLTRFGSIQLVEFVDPNEGPQSPFATLDLVMSIGVPVGSAGTGVTVTSIVATTSTPDAVPQTYTEAIELAPGSETDLPLPYNVLSFLDPGTYVVVVVVQGTRSSDGATCTGSDSVSLTVV